MSLARRIDQLIRAEHEQNDHDEDRDAENIVHPAGGQFHLARIVKTGRSVRRATLATSTHQTVAMTRRTSWNQWRRPKA